MSNDFFPPTRYPGGTSSDVPYAGGPYGAARPAYSSPPGSQHPSTSTDGSRPSASGSSMHGMRPPSSSSSIGGFAPPPPHKSGRPDSVRSQTFKPGMEEALQKHYGVLKNYLASQLRDEKGNMKSNRARDKLLRLSVTQFMELSTDVYDELVRREDERLHRQADVPRFLLPKQNFHPKRNQARQKLSTLPLERFRQLATDVFYELERRMPRFVGNGIERPNSAASNVSRNAGRHPPPGHGYLGPPGPAGRLPMAPNGITPNGMAPPNVPYQSYSSASPTVPPNSGHLPGSSRGGSLGRPLPKSFQSNTIIPNKSTMVEEDDEDEDDEDAFGLDQQLSERFNKVSNAARAGGTEDRDKVRAQESTINDLKLKIEGLESAVVGKDLELRKVDQLERSEWFRLREELEQKHLDAQNLNENLRRELDQLNRRKGLDELEIRQAHDRSMQDLRQEVDQLKRRKTNDEDGIRQELERNLEDLRTQLHGVQGQTSDLHGQLRAHQSENEDLRSQLQRQVKTVGSGVPNSEHERRIKSLQEELAYQEKLTTEVREAAMLALQEMRELSRQNDYAAEQEEKLAARVSALEKEVEEWRQRYARVKGQNKSLRASSNGLGLQIDAGSLLHDEGLLSDRGLVADVDVTRFQLAIDDLLKVARKADAHAMLHSVKSVAVCVQAIASAVGTDAYPTPSPSPLSPRESTDPPVQTDSVGRLKTRVMGLANSLITATKQHASALGLSPVALLDAAASNLTAAVIELVKAVGIRPPAPNDLQSAAGDGDGDDDLADFYDERLSPGKGRVLDDPHQHRHQHPHQQEGPTSGRAAPGSAPEARPAPLNIGHSKSTNKGGWFGGWGKSGIEEPSTGQSGSVNHNNLHAEVRVQDDDYDPYR